jgi:hypothetical protein
VALLICSILSISARFFAASLAGSIFFFFGIGLVYAGRGGFYHRGAKLRATRTAVSGPRRALAETAIPLRVSGLRFFPGPQLETGAYR